MTTTLHRHILLVMACKPEPHNSQSHINILSPMPLMPQSKLTAWLLNGAAMIHPFIRTSFYQNLRPVKDSHAPGFVRVSRNRRQRPPAKGIMNQQGNWTIPIAAIGVGAALAVTLIGRFIKRSASVEIRSALRCECGKIQGEIRAKPEDTIRLLCYCKDCQEYAHFVAREGLKKVTCLGSGGSTDLVQVCKNAVAIESGRDQLQLSRKCSPQADGKTPHSMYRYYSKCCHVPIMNTEKQLGFVGVVTDRLDSNREKFVPTVRYCAESATGPALDVPNVSIFNFLWNLARYSPWSGTGPFDYEQTPTYWGGKEA